MKVNRRKNYDNKANVSRNHDAGIFYFTSDISLKTIQTKEWRHILTIWL